MAKKAAEKTAGIDMSGFVPRSKVVDRQPLPENIQRVPHTEGKKFTGVGIFMDSMTGKSEATKELVSAQSKLADANKKLAEFDGATLVKALDPKVVRRSQWANRNEAEFLTIEFHELKAEIANAGGNVQPIKVRSFKGVVDGQPPQYEIVFGHRRHQACLELGLTVNAVIVEEMNDRALFEAMDRENRGRKNLSAWEQGRMYAEAIKKGLYSSGRNLEEALGLNHSDVVRALQLAKLPKEVVDAFATPLDLQVRWAKPLADALQRDPDVVLVRAREITKNRSELNAAQVFECLIGKDEKLAPEEIQISAHGRKVATLRTGSKGRVVIEFEIDVLPANKRPAFAKLITEFLKK